MAGWRQLLAIIPYTSSADRCTLVLRASEFDGQRAGIRLSGSASANGSGWRPARSSAPNSRIAFPRTIASCCAVSSAARATTRCSNESDESLVAIAREELRRILGLTAAPVFHAISRWPRSMAQYTSATAARLKEIERSAAAGCRDCIWRATPIRDRHPGLHSHWTSGGESDFDEKYLRRPSDPTIYPHGERPFRNPQRRGTV